jgi:TolA-binding protein
LFWQGNALYATRDYSGALAAYRGLIQASPEHARAPEASLSIANCQVELKDVPAARETLKRLLADYPQSEAAATARERLARLN